MRRLRRIAPGLVGLALAVLILWRGGTALEASADAHESFAVLVDQPAPIVDLTRSPGLATKPSAAERPSWHGRVRPLADRERATVAIDGELVDVHADADGAIELALDTVARAPGWHFVEIEIARRGGRRERVVDPVLLGRFGRPKTEADTGKQRPCGATFTGSPALIRGLLVPLLEREVLPKLRENQHMGPDTALEKAEIELREDAVHFELVLAGRNTLAVSGVVAVAIFDRELWAKLVTLEQVEFEGELRDQARGIGAGGGALVGGLIAGPLAPVGAAAGWYVADRFVSKKARETVRKQIDEGLAQLGELELLPELVELVPGQPRSRVAIGFCEQTGVRPSGVNVGLWISPDPPPSELPELMLGVDEPLHVGAVPTIEALEPDEDLRVELSIDLVNALLTSWTRTDLLTDLIGEDRALERANEQLESWTPLRMRALVPTRPPTLTPAGGPADGFAYGLGGLVIELDGVDEQPWGRVYVSAAGTLAPHWDPDAGELSLTGSLDRLDLTCAVEQPDGTQALQGCFSEVLEAVDVRSRIDAHLRPGARNLPKLALAELLTEELGLTVAALALTRPRPGILRLSAGTRPTG